MIKNGQHDQSVYYFLQKYTSYAGLLALLLFFGTIRLRFLDVPLERDEGEYAYAGQLLLKFIAPYRYCHTMKLPGTAGAYALIMAAFGQSPAAIHFGLLLVNSGTMILIYFLAKRLFSSPAGLAAAASFAAFSIGPSVLGLAAHATQFVILPAVGGMLVLLKAIDAHRKRLFAASGFLLGIAFIVKQPGFFFILFGLFYLVYRLRAQAQRWRIVMMQSGFFLRRRFCRLHSSARHYSHREIFHPSGSGRMTMQRSMRRVCHSRALGNF